MFEIRFSKNAEKYLRKLDRITKNRIKKALLILAENPFKTHLDIKKLAGYDDSFRLRIGKYRVLYKIMKNNEIIVFVFDLDSRGDIYK